MLVRKLVARVPGQLLALTVAMVGTTGSAHAAYAVSYDTITNFDVNFSGLVGTFNGFTFSTDVAANGLGSSANYAPLDAASACVGTACTAYNNSFTSHGAAGDYAYGDAQIANSNVMGGVGSASSIGEISAVGSAGFANGANTMTAFFTLGADGSASFAFDATPYLSISAGSTATAVSSMSISILNGSGIEVFRWTPNGNIGTGIVGGTESLDAYNLNTGITPGLTFNPGTGQYQASTNALGAGNYSVSINMANQVTAVPEADTWVMLAVGLCLVGFAVRRRKQHHQD